MVKRDKQEGFCSFGATFHTGFLSEWFELEILNDLEDRILKRFPDGWEHRETSGYYDDYFEFQIDHPPSKQELDSLTAIINEEIDKTIWKEVREL